MGQAPRDQLHVSLKMENPLVRPWIYSSMVKSSCPLKATRDLHDC
jgi:hypothetical protein